MIQQLTGTDEAAGRCCLIGLQVLIKLLKLADQSVDRCSSSGLQVLINWLRGADQLADSTSQAADRHGPGGRVGVHCGAQ